MQRVSKIAMLVAGLLGGACALAEDHTIQIHQSVPLTNYESPFALTISSDSRHVIDALEFQDNSALGRLKRMRELPLLTLSQSKKSRIFLGVNSDGLVGLHFRLR